MSTQTPTRRSFLTTGALLAVPALTATAAATHAPDPMHPVALRDLHQAWLRRIEAGHRDPRLGATVRRIMPDLAGAADRINVAPDGRTANGQYDCVVELQTPLPQNCTLAQMARVQGHGTLKQVARRRLNVDYTLGDGGWQIERVELKRL